jgi:hypothetical protein
MSTNPTRRGPQPAGRDLPNEARVNEEYQTLLRDAAEKREERQRVHSLQDADAARQEILDLLSLSRAEAAHLGRQ